MLMSYRSINLGFDSLRRVLPASNENDSRATTLKKAVDYINHLESLLQESRRNQSDPRHHDDERDSAFVKGETE